MNSGGIEGSDGKIRKEIRKNLNNITEDFLKEKDFLVYNHIFYTRWGTSIFYDHDNDRDCERSEYSFQRSEHSFERSKEAPCRD